MKKIFTLALICAVASSVNGQTAIPNGAFENWTTFSTEMPVGYMTSYRESYQNIGVGNAFKTTDKYAGTYAIKLETLISGQDTQFAYVANGDPGNTAGQGVPYSQQPTAFTGYYKYDIKAGDSAIFWLIFKKAGVTIGDFMFRVGGTQSTYKAFSFPLSLTTAPDSLIVAAASSDPFVPGAAKHGSTLYLDNLGFAGATAQIPNGDFENWATTTVEEPSTWYTNNDYAEELHGKPYASKTTDKYKGSFALKLETLKADSIWYFSNVSTGNWNNGNRTGGHPYSQMQDTLFGWYKYTPQGQDSANINISFYKNGNNFDGRGTGLPVTGNTFTYFSMPFSISQAPDTIEVQINSSNWPIDDSNIGSLLIIDEIQLASQKLNTGIGSPAGRSAFNFYPNPATDYVTIAFNVEESNNALLRIVDITGKVVFEKEYSSLKTGLNQVQLNISSLAAGTYSYRIENGHAVIENKFVVTK